MSEVGGALLRPDKQQRTLFSMKKIVRLDSSSVCFTQEDLAKLKDELLDVTKTKHELLTILRKVDCYKLAIEDVETTDLGVAVVTLASCNPKPDISRLATSILSKWRDIKDTAIFQPLPYDTEAAAAAPDGEAAAPEVFIAAEKEQLRIEKVERRRKRIEEDFMASSSSDDGIEDSEESDPEWAPKAAAQPAVESKRVYRSRAYAQKFAAAAAETTEKIESVAATPEEEEQEEVKDDSIMAVEGAAAEIINGGNFAPAAVLADSPEKEGNDGAPEVISPDAGVDSVATVTDGVEIEAPGAVPDTSTDKQQEEVHA